MGSVRSNESYPRGGWVDFYSGGAACLTLFDPNHLMHRVATHRAARAVERHESCRSITFDASAVRRDGIGLTAASSEGVEHRGARRRGARRRSGSPLIY